MIDGGVAAGDPTQAAVSEVLQHYEYPKVLVLSLGTGIQNLCPSMMLRSLPIGQRLIGLLRNIRTFPLMLMRPLLNTTLLHSSQAFNPTVATFEFRNTT